MEIDSPYNRKLMVACGLVSIPDRRTFDRRLKTISADIKQRIAVMGELFVTEKLVEPYIVTPDSSLLRARGAVWHKSSMKKGEVVPHSGIDTDARWGYSRTKGWVFGYKLHVTSSTGSLTVPLSADFTTANVPDNQLYVPLASVLPDGVKYAAADSGYDDQKLYDYSSNVLWIDPVCPIEERYEHTPDDRLELMHFYESEIRQAIYSWRSVSVEPLIEHIKSVFRIDPLPVRGYHKAAAVVLLSVFLYQVMVYYNCKTDKDNPKSIKYMIGTY
ncbi:MAG: transposase [Nitrososphaera sp.]